MRDVSISWSQACVEILCFICNVYQYFITFIPSSALTCWSFIMLRCKSPGGVALLYEMGGICSLNTALFARDSWFLPWYGFQLWVFLDPQASQFFPSVTFLYVQTLLLMFAHECCLLISSLLWYFSLLVNMLYSVGVRVPLTLLDSLVLPTNLIAGRARSMDMTHCTDLCYFIFLSAGWSDVVGTAAKLVKTSLG